jgi:hypothetical protein
MVATRSRWPDLFLLLDRWSNDGGEFHEELVGQLLGRRVDESTAELRQLAAHFRLGLVSHQRAFAVIREMHGRAAVGDRAVGDRDGRTSLRIQACIATTCPARISESLRAIGTPPNAGTQTRALGFESECVPALLHRDDYRISFWS